MSFFPNKLLLNILACGLVLSSPFHGTATAANGTAVQPKEKSAPKTLPEKNQWKEFKSESGGFSVMLPKEPEQVTQTIDIPKTDLKITYDTFLSEPSDSVVYVISVWNYPAEIDMSKPEVNLQDGFGGMLAALPGSEVLNMSMNDVQGFKALEFLVKNEDIFFQGKLILVHNTLYQVFTVYKDGETMTDNYVKFINSFKLINPEKRQAQKKGTLNGNGSKKMNV